MPFKKFGSCKILVEFSGSRRLVFEQILIACESTYAQMFWTSVSVREKRYSRRLEFIIRHFI